MVSRDSDNQICKTVRNRPRIPIPAGVAVTWLIRDVLNCIQEERHYTEAATLGFL